LKVTNFTTRTRKGGNIVVRRASQGANVTLLYKAREGPNAILLKKVGDEVDPIVMKATVKADSTMMKAIE